MISTLEMILNFIWAQFAHIWVLYTCGSVLGFAIVLWILDRLFHIFDVLKR